MGKINQLDASVFNVLAAGEVVERPASVVKELLENAIDAGATQISVTIEGGGSRKISVADNGIGIAGEDLRAAFLPHATSKINSIADLDTLATLGFRGEALASIASVSRVALSSRLRGSDEANEIRLSGGEVISVLPSDRAEGTLITVEDLFFNTPARLKFLKKDSVEQKYVEETVASVILANPAISITLKAEDKILLNSFGGELIDAICAVYGAKVASKLIPIEERVLGGVKVAGYISPVELVRSNRSCQNAIINGRYVFDAVIQTAVEKAYGNSLMKRCYPIYVLDIVLPFDEVDVNVHPRKTEVRFYDKHKVFSAVYHAVADALGGSEGILAASDTGAFDSPSNEEDHTPAERQRTYVQPRIDTSRLYDPALAKRSGDYMLISRGDRLNDAGFSFVAPVPNESEEEDAPIFDGKIVGQIFATYLAVERDGVLYLIDQHAAHERILYDKIVRKLSAEYSQPLLIPYRIPADIRELEYFESVKEQLEGIGFEFSLFDGGYLVTAVPEAVSRINFSEFFRDLFASTLDAHGISLKELINDRLATQACKGAIKGGEALTREQIERVLATLSEDGHLPTQCPHGRPAVIAITQKDIEKLFKRIV